MDFDSEDDSKTSVSPKCVLEVIGVSKWDGQVNKNSQLKIFEANCADDRVDLLIIPMGYWW